MFWKKRDPVIETVDPVVEASKKRIHKRADNAKREADRLTKIFADNGITLSILKMAGRGHGH